MPKVRRVLESVAMANNQSTKEAAVALANLTLRRRDIEIGNLSTNVLEGHKLSLRVSSFTSQKMCHQDVVNKASKDLEEFNVSRASINMMALKPAPQR